MKHHGKHGHGKHRHHRSILPPAPSPGKSVSFMPPHLIKAKAVPRRGAPDAMLRAAEQAIEKMVPQYEVAVAQDLAKLTAIFEQQWKEPQLRVAAVARMFRISHDVKGQGTTFGFPLATAVGDSLCRYLEVVPPNRQREAAIHVHLVTLGTIVNRRVRGDGGEVGREIVSHLARLAREREGHRLSDLDGSRA